MALSNYHLLEYLGVIALWSWLGDLVPGRIRGRFVGRRERWLNVGRIVGMLGSGLFSFYWRSEFPRSFWWLGYAIPAMLGAVMMVMAILPLRHLPTVTPAAAPKRPATLRSVLAPLGDRRYLRLLVFGCWMAVVNGLTQSIQFIYPIRVLQISLFAMLSFRVGMRYGQSVISPTVGRLADRYGNRPLMILAQLVVATGPLFFLLATPRQPWWIAGAFMAWIAYAGLNVCLPNVMLKLSPEADNGPHIATYFAITGVFYGLSTIGGGILLDWLASLSQPLWIGAYQLDYAEILLLSGWALRTLGVIFLLLLIEPGARTWREIMFRKQHV